VDRKNRIERPGIGRWKFVDDSGKESPVNQIRITSDGDIRIPKSVARKYHWMPGKILILHETAEGLLLKPASPFPNTSLDDVASSLKWSGPPKTLEDMEEAIQKGVMESANDRR
jgi:bifunctional DNA-binding transcriptional regulator/antitoxin component of YhaV-PrlF toxin-antitoxin module